ncbi:hypothetical protein BDN72DRAFT_642757 [Pluteus cervinus]|uniref:Uncharacterized protein n=1 Tax=Pluteus cervinus TaxID=181527 RepID=A0ACD3ATK2_9AGAR|nr:hypothetical protein BDN72DRAFT_642757 [Pluteus cervinus]
MSQPYWLASTWTGVDDFVRTYPHLFYVLSWCIFFGPIVFLIPLLFVHELGVILLHSLTFLLHGLVSSESYYSIRDSLLDSKEAMFATVEAWSASFNKLTTEKYPIMLIRVVAGIYGMYVMIGILWWPIISQNELMPVWEILAELWEVIYKQYFNN